MESRIFISRSFILLAPLIGALAIGFWLFLRPQIYRRRLEGKSKASYISLFFTVLALLTTIVASMILYFMER